MLIEIGSLTLEVTHTANYRSWAVYLRVGRREWYREVGLKSA